MYWVCKTTERNLSFFFFLDDIYGRMYITTRRVYLIHYHTLLYHYNVKLKSESFPFFTTYPKQTYPATLLFEQHQRSVSDAVLSGKRDVVRIRVVIFVRLNTMKCNHTLFMYILYFILNISVRI